MKPPPIVLFTMSKSKSPKKSGSPTATRVCWTINNYTDKAVETLEKELPGYCKYAVFGKEGKEPGKTPHLQGFFILLKKQRLGAINARLQLWTGIHPHTEIAKGSNEQAADYCKKEGDFWEYGTYPKGKGARTDVADFFKAVESGMGDIELSRKYPKQFGSFSRAKHELRIAVRQEKEKNKFKEMHDKPLKAWQKVVMKKLEAQDDRKVTWVYDSRGGIGKSWLANYLFAVKGAFLIEGGKRADVAYAYNGEPIVVFDYTRSQEEMVNYSLIESFKNGRIFSSKYESNLKVFGSAKVLCLSNFDPDRTKLSMDRWQVLEFNV